MTRGRIARLVLQPIVLIAIYQVVLFSLEHWRIPERLLTGNAGGAAFLTMLAVGFLILRLFVLVFLPGWVVGLFLFEWLRHRSHAADEPSVSTT